MMHFHLEITAVIDNWIQLIRWMKALCIHINNDHTVYKRNIVLGTNVASFAYIILPRNNDSETHSVLPYHVLFNLAGSCLTRYRCHIENTRDYQWFIQCLASTITGTSVPLLHFMAVCFPYHFYLQSSHHSLAILGCPLISCYCDEVNPYGFVSTL